MDSKKNILMICSWLDIESNLGSFFWEQAGFLKNDYNIILCVFKKKNIGPKKLLKFMMRSKIRSLFSPNGLSTFYIDYPYIRFLPNKINLFLRNYFIKKFYLKLSKSQVEISLIHAQSLFNAGLEALYMHERTGIPYIFTEHNQITLRDKSKYEISRFLQAINQAQAKLVVSYDKIRQFAANGIYSEFEVVGNGVDSKIFFFDKSKFCRVENVFNIITISAFDLIKDQETILKALKYIDKKVDCTIKFTWIGYDSWGKNATNTVKEFINNFKYDNIEVVIVSKMDRLEIANQLKKSDLFLFSSISEGLPVSVIEALACGLPVCTTRCGGVDELINKKNGKIVQIKDFKAMGTFIIKVLNHNIIYDNEKISNEILEKNGNEIFTKRLKERYDNLLSKKY